MDERCSLVWTMLVGIPDRLGGQSILEWKERRTDRKV